MDRDTYDRDFMELVRRMRDAQRHYFRHRDNLGQCKELEKAVDDAIEARDRPRSPGLFEHTGEGDALP